MSPKYTSLMLIASLAAAQSTVWCSAMTLRGLTAKDAFAAKVAKDAGRQAADPSPIAIISLVKGDEGNSRSLKIGPAVIFAGISAAVAVINMVVTLASPAKEGTVVEVCNDCCVNCASALKEPEGPRIGDCTSEDCLCAAAGPGVTANIFDRTCSTYFHCPGPKRPCGPGTLFNAQYNVCDWPDNVKCAAIAA